MVVLTADGEWDPKVLDNSISENDNWFDAVADLEQTLDDDRFDSHGKYRHHVVTQNTELHFFDAFEDLPTYEEAIDNIVMCNLSANEHELKVKDKDYSILSSFFAYAPVDVIKSTIKNTTQFA